MQSWNSQLIQLISDLTRSRLASTVLMVSFKSFPRRQKEQDARDHKLIMFVSHFDATKKCRLSCTSRKSFARTSRIKNIVLKLKVKALVAVGDLFNLINDGTRFEIVSSHQFLYRGKFLESSNPVANINHRKNQQRPPGRIFRCFPIHNLSQIERQTHIYPHFFGCFWRYSSLSVDFFGTFIFTFCTKEK